MVVFLPAELPPNAFPGDLSISGNPPVVRLARIMDLLPLTARDHPLPITITKPSCKPDDKIYLDRLGSREGGGNINATNPSGAAGAHQFMANTWLLGIKNWAEQIVAKNPCKPALAVLLDDRAFLIENWKHLHYDEKHKTWSVFVSSGHGSGPVDVQKTARLNEILQRRFVPEIEGEMTLAQREDNIEFLRARHIVPTDGNLALLHEQGPIRGVVLIRAAQKNPNKAAADVLAADSVAGKNLKANIRENPLIFTEHYRHGKEHVQRAKTVQQVLGELQRTMDHKIGKVLRAITGKKNHSAHHNRNHNTHHSHSHHAVSAQLKDHAYFATVQELNSGPKPYGRNIANHTLS